MKRIFYWILFRWLTVHGTKNANKANNSTVVTNKKVNKREKCKKKNKTEKKGIRYNGKFERNSWSSITYEINEIKNEMREKPNGIVRVLLCTST